MFALKNSLSLPIRAGNITASGTFLACVSGVNMFNFNAPCLRFIGEKLFKLKKAPFVQFGTLLFAKLDGLSNPSQFFKSNYSSRLKRIYDLFCNHMVDIGSKTVLLLRYFTKVSFGRFATIFLQSTFQLLIALGNFFNLSTAKELVFRGNGNFLNSSVNTNDLAGKLWVGNILAENNVQKYLVLSDKQLSRTSFPCNVLLKIFRNRDWNFYSAIDGKKGKLVASKPNVVTSGIVTDRRLFGLWAGSLLFLSQSCFNTFKRLRSFHSGRYGKLRGKIFSNLFICFMVQRYAIRIAIGPTCLTNMVKCLCVSLNGWFDNPYRDIKFNFNGSC